MLWLSLYLPLLPLHALGHSPHEPRVVLDTAPDSARRVYCLSPAAQARGLRVGMLARTAQALAPDVLQHSRQRAIEEQVLSHLGTWALRFSSQVSLSPPDQLLLEIGRSLRLFGGRENLCAQFRDQLQALGHLPLLGVAPTPRGAELFAQGEQSAVSEEDFQRILRALPLGLLGWPEKTRQKLQAVGLKTIGDCLQLPRGGFSKRYGSAQLRELDRLVGAEEDPRHWHIAPPFFQRDAELLLETERCDVLLPGFSQLFSDLSAYLYGRDCGLLRIQIALYHPRSAPSRLLIGLQKPSRDPVRWLGLLEEKLDRLELPEAVRKIAVRVEDFEALESGQQSLLPDTARADRSTLLETLSTRLAPAGIHSVALQDDHRPEYAWRSSAAMPGPAGGRAAAGRVLEQRLPPRPLWLRDSPEPITPGELQLHSEAERIESGWWDGRPCRRDYYRARARDGRKLWVYREFLGGAEPARWFVHGYFG